jgi:hypothetical protein
MFVSGSSVFVKQNQILWPRHYKRRYPAQYKLYKWKQSWQAEIRQLDKTTTNAENRYPEGNIEKNTIGTLK